jgi:hypothetical protein
MHFQKDLKIIEMKVYEAIAFLSKSFEGRYDETIALDWWSESDIYVLMERNGLDYESLSQQEKNEILNELECEMLEDIGGAISDRILDFVNDKITRK